MRLLTLILLFLFGANSFGQYFKPYKVKYSPVYLTSSIRKHKGYWRNIVNYDIKNNNQYFGVSENSEFKKFDSLSRIALERFIVDRFNYFRKKKYSAKPLIWDDDLGDMCLHQIKYQRLLKKQTHLQKFDFPNFNEMSYERRVSHCKSEFPKFKHMSEGILNQNFAIKNKEYYKGVLIENIPPTFKILTDMFFTPKKGYNTCEWRWKDIMDQKWDCIYMYYDFDFHGDSSNNNFSFCNVMVVFAQYTDEYKGLEKEEVH